MTELLLITLLTLLASALGTLSGFGTSTVMVPVLTLFFPLPTTLLFVGIIHLFGDLWKMALFRRGVDWRIVLAFAVPGAALSYLGATLTVGSDTVVLERILGGFLFAYVVFLFLHEAWRLPRSNATAVTGGALSGFFAGIFGVGGAVRGAFLAAFDLPKATYIFASGAIALAIDVVRVGTYLIEGVRLEAGLLAGLLLSVPASLLGAYFAKKAVDRIPQGAFRAVIAAVLATVAMRFMLFPGG